MVPVSLTIANNQALTAVGESIKLAAMARMSDGAFTDVSDLATWSSQFPGVISVVRGTVTALALGSSAVSASYQGRNGSTVVTATPPGTFALLSGIREPGAGGLSGVLVTADSTGSSGVSNSSGTFTLGGLTDYALTMEKPGFETERLVATPTEFGWFPMQRVYRIVSGDTVTFQIAPHDMIYALGSDRCYPCKFVRIVDAAGVPVRVTIRWTSSTAVNLNLWTDAGRVGPTGSLQIVHDMVPAENDVRLYVGQSSYAGFGPYVNVTVTVTRLPPEQYDR